MEPPARAALDTGRPWPKLWSDNSHHIHPNWRVQVKNTLDGEKKKNPKISYFPVRELGRTSKTNPKAGQTDRPEKLQILKVCNESLQQTFLLVFYMVIKERGTISSGYTKTPRRLKSVKHQKATVNVQLKA